MIILYKKNIALWYLIKNLKNSNTFKLKLIKKYNLLLNEFKFDKYWKKSFSVHKCR